MKWLKFILSHSIFISVCAAALCYQTFELLHIQPDKFIYGFVFSSTLCSYNFYWLISKFYFSDRSFLTKFIQKNFFNFFFFAVAGIGMLFCLYKTPGIFPQVIVAVILTLAYSLPLWPVKQLAFTRKAGFLKTVLLAFTWTYVTVMIPAAGSGSIPETSIALLFTARFLFMLMLCTIFDSRDINIDKMHALRSLATDVSRSTLQKIMLTVFALYLLTGMLLRYFFDEHAQLAAFLVTGILTFIVYRLSLNSRGYYFYYFLVDGLMLFSALATFVASIS